MPTFNLPVTVVVTDDGAAVEIAPAHIPHPNGTVDLLVHEPSTGFSKRHPKDEPDHLIAFNLAMARALNDLADRYAEAAAVDVCGTVEVGGREVAPTPVFKDLPSLLFNEVQYMSTNGASL